MRKSLESLENRVLFAAVNWTGGGDGVNWADRRNWSSNAVPTINDDVTINSPSSDPVVTIRQNAAARSILSNETMYLMYNQGFVTLKVGTSATVNKEFRTEGVMDGGTWGGTGVIRVLNNAAIYVNAQTVNNDVILDNTSAWSVDGNANGNFTFNGTMYLGHAGTNNPNVFFMDGEAPRTLAGTGTFVFDSNESLFMSGIINNTRNPTLGKGNTLTIASGIKFDVRSNGRIFNNFVGGKTIFQGTVNVDGPGKRFVVYQTFVNQGTLRARNGGFVAEVVDDQSVIGNIDVGPGAYATVQSYDIDQARDGTFNIDAPINVPAGATFALSGRFNVNAPINVDGTLLWEYTGASPIQQLRQMIRAGFNGGAWTGTTGIRSSAAAADKRMALGYAETSDLFGPNGGSVNGVPLDGSALVIRATRVGDANLDGQVNFDDYARIDLGFNTGANDWGHGDFNYDGVVNFDDYALIDLAFNTPANVGSRPAKLPAKLVRWAPALAR